MKRLSALLVFVLFTVTVSGQSIYNFLNLDTNPRAAAVAGSFVAANDDPNVIFYNPAGMNFLTGIPISVSYVKHLLDINSASVVVSKEFEDVGRFNAAVKYISYGSFTESTSDGIKTGTFGASDFALILGYGNVLGENFYYGTNVKFIYSGIAGYASTAAAFDVGLHYAIPESNWNFGFSILNIGTQITSYIDTREELPLDIRLGFSKQLEKLPFKFFWSFNKLNERYDNFFDRFRMISAGGEFRFGKSFKLRFGYDSEKRKELRIAESAGLAGFSIGVGFNVSTYVVDYSFSSMGDIGSLHRFGISTNL